MNRTPKEKVACVIENFNLIFVLLIFRYCGQQAPSLTSTANQVALRMIAQANSAQQYFALSYIRLNVSSGKRSSTAVHYSETFSLSVKALKLISRKFQQVLIWELIRILILRVF